MFNCGCPIEKCHCADQFRTFGEVCVNCHVGYHVDENGHALYTEFKDEFSRPMVDILSMFG